MIVDTSALVAMVAHEHEASPFERALSGAGRASVSAGSWVEFSTVLVRKFRVSDPIPVLSAMSETYDLAIVPVTPEQVSIAARGYATYGRGTGHRARLNFGDCFAYALAKATGEPLLFKGDDFTHTDVRRAI